MTAKSKNKIPTWARSAIAAIVVVVPLGAMSALLVKHANYKVDFARWEMYGTEYLRPASRLLVALSRLRVEGHPGGAGAAASFEEAVSSEIRALKELERRLSEPLETTSASLAARGRQDAHPFRLEALWGDVRRDVAGGKWTAETEAAVTKLEGAVKMLITHVGDASKLILDPDLDTYYVMDALLLREPELLPGIAAVADQSRALAGRKAITLEERNDLAGKLALLVSTASGVSVDVSNAIQETGRLNNDTTLAASLAPRAAAALAAVKRLESVVRQGVLVAVTPATAPAEIEQAAAAAVSAHAQVWADLFDHEDVMLRTRLDGDLASRRHVIWSAFALGVLMAFIFVRVRRTIGTLQSTIGLLTEAVGKIEEQNGAHGQALTRQAAALQETQTTAQQIKQTSQIAAQSAVEILEVVERADTLGRAGEGAVEASLHGLQDIRQHFTDLAVKIRELNERTLQIGGITQSVKDLADQSNMLALNAAIEAARSGEHGKGFSVVAREIRNLADQSIQATNRAQELLGSIGSAIRQAVSVAETGGQRIEHELDQVKQSGESLRHLSKIVQESSSGVRQIASAVGEQNVGILQIFGAVIDQNRMMEDTVKRLDHTREATDLVKTASQKLVTVAEQLSV
jgi:methyl-accepting chemotaxis protein